MPRTEENPRILFTGGGTLGSVSPLLAIWDEFRRVHPGQNSCVWIGTDDGPERRVVEMAGIPFLAISCGKLRRYWSWKNITDVFSVARGYFQAKQILRRVRPRVVVCAGGYVGVPVVYAAARMGIPTVIHQQDVRPGLANQLMARVASRITVTFEGSKQYFLPEKTVVTGNPARQDLLQGKKEIGRRIFGLSEELPVLFFTGGGTGALELNRLVARGLSRLTQRYQILHLTGRGKETPEEDLRMLSPVQRQRYHSWLFFGEEMKHAYAVADLVVCRAGFSTATELALLGKPALMIPIPDSHQVDNARYFEQKGAVVVGEQKTLTPEILFSTIEDLFLNPKRLETLSINMRGLMDPDAARKLKEEIERVVHRKAKPPKVRL